MTIAPPARTVLELITKLVLRNSQPLFDEDDDRGAEHCVNYFVALPDLPNVARYFNVTVPPQKYVPVSACTETTTGTGMVVLSVALSRPLFARPSFRFEFLTVSVRNI